MNNSQKNHTFYLRPTGIFLLCALLIILAGYALFEIIKTNEKNDTNKTLVSVGHLKTHEIQSYLAERKNDAAVISSFLSTPSSQHWLAHQSDNAPEILNQLAESVVKAYQYRGLLLLDAKATIRLSAGRSGILTAAGKAIALRAMHERSPASFQIYFGDPSTPDVPVLDTFVPVLSTDGAVAVGMVVLRNELNYLFQLLQVWPVESETAESLLITREGSDVLFLNELRHQKETSLKLRIPLNTDPNSPAWPAISAVTGHFGLIEANDYRNKRILAYTIAVPDTRWSMVVKMDIEEAVAHSLRLLRVAIIITVAFILFAGMIVWLWWRKDQAEQLANKQLHESEIRYRRLHESMMDAFVMVDMTGHLLEFNHSYQEMLGYSAVELLRLSCADLTPEKWHEFEKRIIAEQVIPNGQSQVYEKEYIRKDGTVIPVELKYSLLMNKNKQPEAMWAIVRDITERKRTEQVLQQGADRIEMLLNSVAEGIYGVDRLGDCTFINAAGLHMLGYQEESELTGKNMHSLIHHTRANGSPYPAAECRLYSCLKFQKNVHVDDELFWRKDGSSFPVDYWSRPIILNGEVGAVITFLDITERKLAEEALRASENRYRLLVESSPFCIHEIDLEGRLQSMNRAGLNMLGLDDARRICGMPYLGAVSQQDAGRIGALLRDAITNGTQSYFEFAAAGDVLRYFKSCFIPIKDARGKMLKLMGISEDITERRQADEQLRRSSEEIEDLYNHAPCGYHSLDKDGNIRLMNDTELSWLGYTRDEVIGKMKWQDLLAPASLSTFRESFPQLLQQGSVRDIEIEIIRKDSTAFTGLVNATAIYDSGGNYVMSRSTIIDITERKRAKRRMQDLSAHLQTVREEEKASIAREIHDDLGGTLTALKMEAYWLAEELSAIKETEPLLKHVELMSQLTENAVNVTRRVITGLRPTILDDLGLLAALEWQAEQFRKHTGIGCRVNGIDDKVKLDSQYAIVLFRIFQESLTNVARHSGASRVEVEFHGGYDEVMLSISDNGRGLPEGHTVASGSYGMRGMSERVEQLGGRISFGSPPGGGFSVTVILPLPVENKEGEEA
jgi:PAS domain S-box-containing protein